VEQSQNNTVFVFEAYKTFQLIFSKVDHIDRAEAFGRLAISCEDSDVEKVFSESGSKFINSPITLKTEGKADVIVTIL